MANHLMKTTAIGLIAAGAFVGGAQAGGWNRGEADTDILFEDGDVVVRGGYTFVMPKRGYDTIGVGGAAGTDDDFSQNYSIPSFAAKVKVSDNFACAFTYTQPFGADADYGAQAQAAGAAQHKDFITNEYGATCAVNMDAGMGKAYLLGGFFLQDFDYTARSEITGGGGALGTLSLEDTSAYGYRLGAAYAIPEYAMRFQLMYRSKIDHTTNVGSFDWTELNPVLGSTAARGNGTLPQSLKLSVQSGVAPGWLVYGSVKWTDWSVMDSLNYSIDIPGGLGGGVSDREDVYNWKDGWTIQAGVGHSFNEKISGTVNLTWDKGVDSGADIYTDSWTLGAGVLAKVGPGELRAGAGLSYLTSGSQSTAQDAVYDATAGGDWAYAVTASYKVSF